MKKSVSLLIASLLFSISARAAELSAWSAQPGEHPSTVALQQFLGKLKESSSEHFDSKLLPPASVGDQNKLIKALQSGEIGVAVIAGSTIGKISLNAQVLQLPFIFRDTKQMFGVLEGEVGKAIEKDFRDKGMVLVGWYDGGARSFYMRNKPLRSTADFQGLKVRIPNRTDTRNLINTLGGSPTPLAYQEVNAAFDAGSIDAAENDLVSYEADQHYKRAKYFLVSNHFVQFEALVVSNAIWSKLSDAEKKTIGEAGRESAIADRELWTKRLAATRSRLEKEGVKFIEQRDGTPFISRLAGIYKPYIDNPATSALLLRLMTERS